MFQTVPESEINGSCESSLSGSESVFDLTPKLNVPNVKETTDTVIPSPVVPGVKHYTNRLE